MRDNIFRRGEFLCQIQHERAFDITEQTTTPARPDNQTQPMLMTKRIGSTNYRVAVHFSRTSRESLDDKILRLIRNDTESGKAVVTN